MPDDNGRAESSILDAGDGAKVAKPMSGYGATSETELSAGYVRLEGNVNDSQERLRSGFAMAYDDPRKGMLPRSGLSTER